MTATAPGAVSLDEAPLSQVVEPAPRPRTHRPGGLPYLPALDGLRALAVVAVIAYHLDLSWAPGGFLGVDLFFVISGFLITSLLVNNVESRGRLGLGNFYWRRAKRLLPALGATLLAVGAWAALVATDVVDNFRREVVAAILYVSNWYLVANDESYFEAFGRPSPLRHLWSLAIEEQFYLIWPVGVAVLLAAFLSRRRVAVVVAIGALLSFVWMAALYEPFTDPSRVYYGTDTRLGGLLLGAALALVWQPWRRTAGPVRRSVAAAVGLVGVIGFGYAVLAVGDTDPGLYRLGFLWISLFGVMTVLGAAQPGSWYTAVLSSATLVAIGRRSYAMYLVHWPIIVFTRPGVDVPLTGWVNTAFRLALIVAATELLHRVVEVPIRQSSFEAADIVRTRWWGNPDFVAGTVVVLLVVTVVAIRPATEAEAAIGPQDPIVVDVFAESEQAAPAGPGSAVPGAVGGPATSAVLPDIPAGGRSSSTDPPAPTTTVPVITSPSPTPTASIDPAPTTAPAATAAPPTTAPAAPPTTAPVATTAPVPTTAAPPATTAPPTTAAPAPVVPPTLVIGDSVALGAGPSLTASLGPQVVVDAAVSRQFSDLAAVVDGHAQNGLPPAVVLHLGTNGNISPDDVAVVMGKLAGVPRVLLVNARVPRSWEGAVNATLAQAAADWPNAVLVDWHAHSAGHGDWFVADGVHLSSSGIAAYVSLVGRALVA